MKKLVFSALSFMCFSASYGQNVQLSPQVIAAGGNHFEGSNLELSYTIGELAAISTISSSNFTLTQGFHQPDKFTIILVEPVDAFNSMSLYPNPASDFTRIKIESEKPYDLTLRIYDSASRLVQSGQIIQSSGMQEHTLDTSELAGGTYFIRLSSENGEVDTFLKMTKTFN